MPGFCGRLLWYLGVGIGLDPEPWCHVDLCCACLDACVVRVCISVVRVEVKVRNIGAHVWYFEFCFCARFSGCCVLLVDGCCCWSTMADD